MTFKAKRFESFINEEDAEFKTGYYETIDELVALDKGIKTIPDYQMLVQLYKDHGKVQVMKDHVVCRAMDGETKAKFAELEKQIGDVIFKSLKSDSEVTEMSHNDWVVKAFFGFLAVANREQIYNIAKATIGNINKSAMMNVKAVVDKIKSAVSDMDYNEFRDVLRDLEHEGIEIIQEQMTEDDDEDTSLEPSDDLKSNFRSWEYDHEEDGEKLFNILCSRHPKYDTKKLKQMAYDWVGQKNKIEEMNTFDVQKRNLLTFDQFCKTQELSSDADNIEKGEADLVKKAMSGDKTGDKGVATLDDPKKIKVGVGSEVDNAKGIKTLDDPKKIKAGVGSEVANAKGIDTLDEPEKIHIKLFEQFLLNEGTGNFYNKNASKIFAIGEGDDDDTAEMNYENGKSNVEFALEEAGYTIDGKSRESDENRNFPGIVIARKTENKSFGEIDASVTLLSILRTGYYQGANFDWSFEIEIGNSEYTDEIPDSDVVQQDVMYYLDAEEVNDKVEKKSEEILSWVEKTKDKMVADIENLYKERTMPLKVIARFSSGETHYGHAE